MGRAASTRWTRCWQRGGREGHAAAGGAVERRRQRGRGLQRLELWEQRVGGVDAAALNVGHDVCPYRSGLGRLAVRVELGDDVLLAHSGL